MGRRWLVVAALGAALVAGAGVAAAGDGVEGRNPKPPSELLKQQAAKQKDAEERAKERAKELAEQQQEAAEPAREQQKKPKKQKKHKAAHAKKAKKLPLLAVFHVDLKPKYEVPKVKGVKAGAEGTITLDLTRDAAGAIASCKVSFNFNYRVPPAEGSVTGLHVHTGGKGATGPVSIDSGLVPFADPDGVGNITLVVMGAAPATCQQMLDDPRAFYVNLHTTLHPDGLARDQLGKWRKG